MSEHCFRPTGLSAISIHPRQHAADLGFDRADWRSELAWTPDDPQCESSGRAENRRVQSWIDIAKSLTEGEGRNKGQRAVFRHCCKYATLLHICRDGCVSLLDRARRMGQWFSHQCTGPDKGRRMRLRPCQSGGFDRSGGRAALNEEGRSIPTSQKRSSIEVSETGIPTRPDPPTRRI